jgi:iron complex outermembrane receptor protein
MKANNRVATPLVRKSAIAVAVAAALATSAVAQENAPIEEVVVTATKRAVNIQDVPLAVTSVSGDKLQKMQITDILSLEKAIPGLTIASYGNNAQAIMRGAGTAGTTDIAVPIYHDGMYIPRYGQALAGYVDIERVEALRGPQGTLFGRNTYGGLINVITKKPDLSAIDFGASISAGDYSLRKVEGFVNLPINEVLGFRVTFADEERDPYVKNIINPDAGLKDSDYTYARAQLLYQPTDNFSINLKVSHWEDTANGNLNYAYKGAGIPLDPNDMTLINAQNGVLDPRMGIYSGPNCPDGDRPGGRSQAGNVCNGDPGSSVISDPFVVDFGTAPRRKLEDTGVYVSIDWDTADHNIKLNAARFDYKMLQLSDADFSRNAAWFDGDYINNKSTQVDLTITSTFDSPFQYTAGVYRFNDQDDGNTAAYLFGSLEASWSGYAGATPTTPSWAYWNNEGRGGTKSTAFYGQADYSFAEKWTATAGIRYTEDDRRSQRANGLPFDPTQRLGPELPTYQYGNNAPQTGFDTSVDYRLGLAFNATDDTMIYGSVATAYIAGATDPVNQNLLDPQTNDTVEIGVKSTLLDGRLTMNASAYSAQYEGLNTTKFVIQGTSGVAVAVQVPGGSIKSQGIELEGFWYPSDNLTIDFGLTLENSEYDEFIVGAGNLIWNGTPPIGSQVISGESVFVMDGKPTAYSPDMTLGVGVSYEYSLGDKGTLTPYLNAYYNSGYWTNRAPVFFGEQTAYTEIDFSLGWRSSDGVYSASLWVNNATDELIQTYTEIYSRARVAYDYQAPRAWGLRVGYNF